MATRITDIIWKGEYAFRLSGSGLHEDTLRIKATYRKQEHMLRLVLPTLCITYAESKFQDSIGGAQENYPASRVYGPAHFNPPVEILGEEDIEKFTYIRGAYRVEIGPKLTLVEFQSWKDLVIPRLRLDQKKPAYASILIPETRIDVSEPLQITALQYADGRHVGGVRLEKRHPKWKPEEEDQVYSLWVRVIDGFSLQPIPEVMVDVRHQDPKMKTYSDSGGFLLDERLYTDGNGCIQVSDRPSGELEAIVVRRPGWRTVVRCFRPLKGQKVRMHVKVWPLKRDQVRISLPVRETLDLLAERTGHSSDEILKINRLRSMQRIKPGMNINLPSFMGTYHMESWDTYDWVGKSFGYKNAIGLAQANGFKKVDELNGKVEIRLPDWHFYYAGENDTLEKFDVMFGLPKGSSITVGRSFHPDPGIPYAGETVAVPSHLFAQKLKRLK